MQTTKTVVDVFGVRYESWSVEYFDGKEWIGATGPWDSMLNVQPFYTDVDAAKYVARLLHTLTGDLTRVVKEEESK